MSSQLSNGLSGTGWHDTWWKQNYVWSQYFEHGSGHLAYTALCISINMPT